MTMENVFYLSYMVIAPEINEWFSSSYTLVGH